MCPASARSLQGRGTPDGAETVVCPTVATRGHCVERVFLAQCCRDGECCPSGAPPGPCVPGGLSTVRTCHEADGPSGAAPWRHHAHYSDRRDHTGIPCEKPYPEWLFLGYPGQHDDPCYVVVASNDETVIVTVHN